MTSEGRSNVRMMRFLVGTNKDRVTVRINSRFLFSSSEDWHARTYVSTLESPYMLNAVCQKCVAFVGVAFETAPVSD